MAIALSQDDYWTLFQESGVDGDVASTADQLDITWKYPSQLGHGFMREICLREGLILDIADYQPHDDIITYSSDREHPLEYTFNLPDGYPKSADTIPYHLFGSGIAPGECGKIYANQRLLWVSVLANTTSIATTVTSPGNSSLKFCNLQKSPKSRQ